jgi:precorrin-6A/cobalt-precorrin-6A reductase
MHRWPAHQIHGDMPTPLIWLLAGTGEGPPLAASLLQRGWAVLVSVVTAEAARAYSPDPRLQVLVGPLADQGAMAAVLNRHRPRWVVDATHPFAQRISTDLAAVCQRLQQPCCRLQRPAVDADGRLRLERLTNLQALRQLDLRQERLLLAIGSRHLPEALAASSAAQHHARVLDRPLSLQLALAAGLRDEQLACLRPDPHGSGAVERALCRRWGITTVLCRQSGGAAEALWHRLCRELDLRLLLLEQPGSQAGLPLAALLEKLGRP